ncbi:RHS repeat-associated core domain-containing protein [Burkholderia diffusa]|uniref:RHS repeat domain-containing protein n=1 Tax=Burkholderia diffusa TaxID=488732 RepID=UPI000B041A6F
MQAWKASGDRLLRFAPQARPDRPVDFTYDGHGNRIARTVPLPPKPELTEAEKRSQRGTDNLLRVMEVLTGTPKYEEPMAAPEVTKYRYDGGHQLIAIEHADGARSEYEYDALGRRVAKHHTQADGARQTTLFMWDGDWMMQEVRTGRTSHEDWAVTYVSHPDHEGPLTRLADGQAWHYVTDHLGTPQELYDEQREVVWAVDLSAYGWTTSRLAHGVDNPIRFPGQYYDEESGLHYNRFRYYDPVVGRYISQDPIGLLGGYNLYAYVRNAPAMGTDLMGLQQGLAGFNMPGMAARASLGMWAIKEGYSPEQVSEMVAPTPSPFMTGECRASSTLAAGVGGSVGVAANEKTGLSGQFSISMVAAAARVSASCGLKLRDPNANDLPASAGIGFSAGIISIDIGQTSTWPELYIGAGAGVGPEIRAPVSPSISVPLF